MMNFIKKTAFIFGFIALFASCTEDEGENDSCYTCETTQTEYCYTVGNTYYVTTDADGATHQTELNGATWSDTQDSLENQCNGNQTASIVGDWNLINYQMNSETTTTIDDVDVITYTESVGVTYNTINHFTENPNQLTSTGTSILRMTFTDENGEETIIDDVELSAVDSTWELNGNMLTTTTDGVTETSEILELTETTLKIKMISTQEDTDLDDNPRSTTFSVLITYERL